MNPMLDVSSAIQSPTKIKDRNSCSTGFSDDAIEIEERINTFELEFQNLNSFGNLYFQPEILQPQITSKIHKRAIHVLFNICWDRDIGQDALWSALMIFYSFKAKRIIKKVDLIKTVSVCILLSCKVLQPEKIQLKDIIQITKEKYSAKQISETEEEILEALGFDIYIQNNFTEAMSAYGLVGDQLDEFCCLAEMLMLKNSQIFWKKSSLSSLIKLIRFTPFQNSNLAKSEFLDLSKSKEGEFILRKYSSKMDTEKLLEKLKNY